MALQRLGGVLAGLTVRSELQLPFCVATFVIDARLQSVQVEVREAQPVVYSGKPVAVGGQPVQATGTVPIVGARVDQTATGVTPVGTAVGTGVRDERRVHV